ncbi:MAG: PEP-CTERM sorting domain-containing protein [Oceanipulchritudo sp.]
MKSNKRLLVTLLSGILATAANGSILVKESATGYTPDTTIVGQNPTTTGFSGAWTNPNNFGLAASVDFYPRSTGLSYTGFGSATGGSLEHFRVSGTAATKQVERPISFTPATVSGSDVLYIGFLFQHSATSGNDVDATVTYGLLGSSRDNNFILDGGSLSIGLAGSNGSTLNLGAVAQDTTHMVLLRVSDNTTGGGGNDAFYDNVEAWLNPDLSNLGTANASGVGIISKFNGSNTDISADGLSLLGVLAAGESFTMDEFFVATDLANVTVPEPSTWALLAGVSALGLVMLRRRCRD